MAEILLDDQITSTNNLRVSPDGHASTRYPRNVARSNNSTRQLRTHVHFYIVAVQALNDMPRLAKGIEKRNVDSSEEVGTFASILGVRNLVDDEDDILRRQGWRSFVSEPGEPDLGALSPARLHLNI